MCFSAFSRAGRVYHLDNKGAGGMKGSWGRMIVLLGGFAGALFFGAGGPGLAGAQTGGGANMFQSYAKPQPVPDFSLEDLGGKTVRMKDYRGKVVLLHFWATW